MEISKHIVVIRALYVVGILPLLLRKKVKLDKDLEYYLEFNFELL